MVLVGTFLWSKVATAFASLGIILAAAYLLWMVQRVAFGTPAPHMLHKLSDLNQREMATLLPLAVLIFVIGIFPNPLLSRMHTSVEHVIARVAPSSPRQSSIRAGLEQTTPLQKDDLLSTLDVVHASTVNPIGNLPLTETQGKRP